MMGKKHPSFQCSQGRFLSPAAERVAIIYFLQENRWRNLKIFTSSQSLPLHVGEQTSFDVLGSFH